MKMKVIISTLLAFAFVFTSATAQDVTYNLSEVTEFKIDGDSNVRSWYGDITDANATLVLTGIENISADGLTPDVFSSLEINIAVDGIESDSGRLTSNLQSYLKGDDYPTITFKLTEITAIDANGNEADITANGVINAAGVDHSISMNVKAVVNSDGSIRFTGKQDLLMTSFDIDPPTAVMGTIRARDEIEIIFDVTFAR
ncbi:MAG: YceI family protein [Balneolaceae bacterium]|nr:YceI family protein [Balneolaceae bacterium]